MRPAIVRAPVYIPYPQLGTLPRGSPELAGPIDTSNWVLPGRLLVGGWPGDSREALHLTMLHALLKAGITVIVNLAEQQEIEQQVPYLGAIERLIQQQPQEFTQRVVRTIRFPIRERTPAGDQELLRLVESVATELKNGEKVYIHCVNGTGRTGTVTAALLVRLFALNFEEALTKTAQFHDAKRTNPGISSPQYVVQFEQVKRIVPNLMQLMTDDPSRAPAPQAMQVPLPTADVAMPDATSSNNNASNS